MAYRTRSILLAGLSALAFSAPALAQQTTPPGESVADETVPDVDTTIIVTGTRRSDRTVADSTVPIDVIGGEALTKTGLTETNKILNQLVPSFNFPQPSIADGTDVLRPATLRGLSPDQTLVLVNGKRRHTSALLNINGTIGRGSAAVDLNMIPTLAIERVEVLRDGAASQYGSDAIAGVINLQLKKASSGGRAVASYGKYVTTIDGVDEIDGLVTNSAGQPVLDPTYPLIFQANRRGNIKARDGAQTTFAANVGIPLGAGYANFTAEYRDRNQSNRSGYDLRPQYNRPGTLYDPRELTFDRRSFLFGDPKTEDFNLFLNAGMPIGAMELYAFGSYGRRDGLSAANYRTAGNSATNGFTENRNYAVLAPGETPTAANFVPLTPDGYLPFIDTKTKDLAGAIGVTGDVAGWDTDLSLSYGHNQVDFWTRNTVNPSFGTATQTDFYDGRHTYGQLTANLDVQREFAVGFARPVSLALGLEYRREGYELDAGDFQSYGLGPLYRNSVPSTAAECTVAQGAYDAGNGVCAFPGRAAPGGARGFGGLSASSATDVDRHNWAAYAEIDADPLPGLTVQVAGRYEHYSDFGGTANGKVAARYEFIPQLAVRGSISTGFRAPSLQQQYFANTATQFVSGVAVDISTVPVNSPVAVALGSRDLKPEKSVNMSIGATARPLRGLNITVDYYKIGIDDRIVLTETLTAQRNALGNPCTAPPTSCTATGAAIATILNANGFQSVGAARFFINGIDTTTRGLDIIGTYRWRAGNLGTWNLTAAYNRNKTKIDKRLSPLSTTIPDLILLGRVEGLRFTDGQPKSKVVLSADGDIGDFGVTARTTRYGKVLALEGTAPLAPNATSLTALGADDQLLSAKWITDLEARYKVMRRVEFAVGANNLFDVYPDVRPYGPRPTTGNYPQNFQYIPYSGAASPFGFNGRFLYGRVSVDF